MANQALADFITLVQKDTTLRLQLQDVSDMESGIKRAVQLGAEKGYSFTEADVREYLVKESVSGDNPEELSDESLESIAGGKSSK